MQFRACRPSAQQGRASRWRAAAPAVKGEGGVGSLATYCAMQGGGDGSWWTGGYAMESGSGFSTAWGGVPTAAARHRNGRRRRRGSSTRCRRPHVSTYRAAEGDPSEI
ncbi:hypothetical protein E2562_029887 [Oryza meyeriana var. granulata]|uniref:Uncharacterized protein n=1 Tax=Oryza meyeriana var. granulata TaxID=110450 RepID=A0A6G1CUM5_9ORYZ|nr:hypothetical protein E2562_029887 [Oryza meyeriana var. granulata]